MGAEYKIRPENFNEIEKILINDKEKILNLFLTSHELYFYDTCSLQCHSNSINSEKIADYIKMNNGTIIITQCVLMELGGIRGVLDENIINYLKIIYDKNINIILFKEEELLTILREFTEHSYEECNKALAFAISEISSASKGIVKDINDEINVKEKIFTTNSKSKDEFKNFFNFALSKKASKDNMGEELIFICFIILSKIQGIAKLIFLSNDLKSRATMCSVIKYTNKHYSEHPYQLTSSTLFCKLVRSGIVKTKEELKELIESSNNNNNIYIYYIDKYSIKTKEASLTSDEYVERIFEEDEFKVIY